MTTYTNFLKLRAQAYNDSNWDVLLNQNFAIVDFAAAGLNAGNRLLLGGVVSDGGGLNAAFTAAVVWVGGVRYEAAAGSVALASGSLNYIYVNSSGTVVAAATPPTGDYVPLAVADAGASTIDRIGDARPQVPAAVPGDNIFINGDMAIDQENAGAAVSVSTVSKYILDMVKCLAANHAAVVNGQQVTGFGGFLKAAQLIVTTGDTLATNENGHGLQRFIEYGGCQRLADRYLAIKFKFKAKVTGTYSVSLASGNGNFSYVTTFSYAVAEAVQDVSLLIPVPAAKIVDGTNNRGLILYVGVAAKGTNATATLNAWQSGLYYSASTATDWETTVGNYIAMTGLHGGADIAHAGYPFRQPGHELSLCRRYYNKGSSLRTVAAAASTTTVQVGRIPFPVCMRTAPTMTATTPTYALPAALGTVSDVSAWHIDAAGWGAYFTTSGATAGTGGRLNIDTWTADARM